MGLSDSILKAVQAHNALATRPYADDTEKAKRDLAQYQAQIGGAEATTAPQYYQGRADTATNQAGLLGMEMQYAPQYHGLKNQLLQAQIGSANRSHAGGNGLSSPFGKLQSDYFRVVEKYGENSPQAQQFQSYMEKQIAGRPGLTVYDPKTGMPLVSTGGGASGGRGGGGGTYVNPETGEIISMPTNPSKTKDQRTIAGSQNVQDYLKTAQETLPQFLTAKDQGKLKAQQWTNYLAGTNYPGPSKYAEGEAAVTTMAEGFINSFGLNATNENVAKAEKIFKPRFGESSRAWLDRTDRQAKELMRVEGRAQGRLAGGNVVGKTNQSLQAQAQLAIARGADPAQVQAQLQQLEGRTAP